MWVQKLLQDDFLGLLVDSLAISSPGVEPPTAAVHALAAIGGFVTAVPPQLQPAGLASAAADGAAAMAQLAADTHAAQVEATEAAAAEKAKAGKKQKDDKKDKGDSDKGAEDLSLDLPEMPGMPDLHGGE